MYESRLSRLRLNMEAKNMEAIALLPGPSMFFLTGLSFHLLERPIIGFFTTRRNPLFIVPELERSKVESSHLEIDVLPYGEDQASRLAAFDMAGETLRLEGARIGIEPLVMRAFELRILEGAIPGAKFVAADDVVSELRLNKDESEIEAMRLAVRVAETALQEMVAWVKPGFTEIEIASELIVQVLRAGSEAEIPFSPIVSSGPNSAFVHATPSNRQLQVGDMLMIDFGARAKGYVSDITRTFAVGEISDEMRKVYEVVKEANEAGKNAVMAGARCSEVDHATRSVIEEAGYGEYFLHRTGHGIGLEGHEGPYISGDNPLILTEGMTFTIEPGLYIPNQGGVRIEDNVAVTSKGIACLTSFPRELQVIAS
jgi:Xaa-Pro dipeptidase